MGTVALVPAKRRGARGLETGAGADKVAVDEKGNPTSSIIFCMYYVHARFVCFFGVPRTQWGVVSAMAT